MGKHDDGKVRLSDFLKKGAAQNGPEEAERVAPDAEKKEVESFRFSDFEDYRSGGRGKQTAGRSSSVEERKSRGDDTTREGVPFDDFEAFKMEKKASQSVRSLLTPSVKEVERKLPEKNERIRASGVIVQDRQQAVRKDGQSTDRPACEGPRESELKEMLPDEKAMPAGPLRKENATGMQPVSQEKAVAPAAPLNPMVLHDETVRCLRTLKGKIQGNRSFELEPFIAVLGKMIDLPEGIDALYPFTLSMIRGEDFNISHQVNVMVYSLMLGRGLGYSREKLIELGVSALLHDVGMFRIPDSIFLKSAKLNAAEVEAIKTHPEIGRGILVSFRGRYAALPDVAFEHHERENGQGYPRGLRGDDIHEYARIVGLVDSYEAMTHNRPYRKALEQSFSAKELIKSKQSLFSPAVVKVFLQEISLYPLGSFVKLNNKAIGEVVATDQKHPLRPSVKILYDGEGNKVFEEVIIQLGQNPLFFIVEGVPQSEVPVR